MTLAARGSLRFLFALNDSSLIIIDRVGIIMSCPTRERTAHDSCTIQAAYTDLLFVFFREHALCDGLRLLSCVSMSLLLVMTSVYAAYNNTIGGNVDPTARSVADAIVSPPLGLDLLPTCAASPRFLGVGPTRWGSEGRE